MLQLIIVIMDAEELEDYLEARDPQVRRFIALSNKEYLAGKSRPAQELLAELQRQKEEEGKTDRRDDG